MEDKTKLEYLKLIKRIVNCDNLEDLKETVSIANEFITNHKLKSSSDEYKRIVDLVDTIRFRLKSKKKLNKESVSKKEYIISETQLKNIILNISEIDSRTNDILNDILDQISEYGEESLTPKQRKQLKDFSAGQTLDYDKPKNRDRKMVKFEKTLPNLPKITFILMETFETDDGFEYLGSLDFNGKEYTGFFVVDSENKVESIEFENYETKKDLFEDSEGLEQEIVVYFDEIADELSNEDLQFDIY